MKKLALISLLSLLFSSLSFANGEGDRQKAKEILENLEAVARGLRDLSRDEVLSETGWREGTKGLRSNLGLLHLEFPDVFGLDFMTFAFHLRSIDTSFETIAKANDETPKEDIQTALSSAQSSAEYFSHAKGMPARTSNLIKSVYRTVRTLRGRYGRGTYSLTEVKTLCLDAHLRFKSFAGQLGDIWGHSVDNWVNSLRPLYEDLYTLQFKYNDLTWSERATTMGDLGRDFARIRTMVEEH